MRRGRTVARNAGRAGVAVIAVLALGVLLPTTALAWDVEQDGPLFRVIRQATDTTKTVTVVRYSQYRGNPFDEYDGAYSPYNASSFQTTWNGPNMPGGAGFAVTLDIPLDADGGIQLITLSDGYGLTSKFVVKPDVSVDQVSVTDPVYVGGALSPVPVRLAGLNTTVPVSLDQTVPVSWSATQSVVTTPVPDFSIESSGTTLSIDSTLPVDVVSVGPFAIESLRAGGLLGSGFLGFLFMALIRRRVM